MTVLSKILNGAAGADVRETLNALLNARQPRVRIASNLGGMYAQSTQLTNGTTQLSGTDRIPFGLNTDYANLQFVLMNAAPASGSGNFTMPGNAVKFRMSFEIGGTAAPVVVPFPGPTGSSVSGGAGSAYAIGNGDIQISGPVIGRGALVKYDSAAVSTLQYLRFYKSVANGEKWPLTGGSGNANYISTNAKTTDIVYGNQDKTGSDQSATSGTPTWGDFATALMWMPLAIVGEQIIPQYVLMGVGDSIIAGFQDGANGYAARGASAAGLGYWPGAVISTTTANLTNNMYGSRYMARYADGVALHIGSNDLANGVWADLAAAQASYLAVARAYARVNNKLFFATILPRVTTTDSLATYANQTKPAWENLRVQINNWIRDKSANGMVAQINASLTVGKVKAVYDPAILLERNSDGSTVTLDGNGQQAIGSGGYFLLGMSGDGTHPNAAGAAIAAPALPVAQMAL